MSEGQEQQKRNRRRRGRRGGRSGAGASGDATPSADDGGSPPGPPGPPGPGGAPPPQSSRTHRAPDASAPRSDNRGPRRDTRGQPRQDRPDTAARTHRPPSSGGSRPSDRDRGPRTSGGGYGRSGSGSRDRDRDRDNRPYEPPVPQDELSIELGAKFKESQVAVRDARKALAKRKAEFDDEPDWMLEQYQEAERAFEEAATAWSEHLETTGRKVVRR